MALKDRFVTSDLDGRARLWCRRHPLVQGLKRNDCVSNIHVVLIINDDCFAKTGSRRKQRKHPKERGERTSPASRKRHFLEFALCLSRACLGKIMHFIYKWRKKCRFLARVQHQGGQRSLQTVRLIQFFCFAGPESVLAFELG
jgi:hypothetical protein